MSDSQFANQEGSMSTTPGTTESKEPLVAEKPTEEEAFSLGVEQGRILAMNPEAQGQADWPWSNDLFADEFRPETCVGQVAAPPVIYADFDLMNAYCTGAVRGFSDYRNNNPKVKLYEVSVVADVQVSLSAVISVYAVDADAAVEKIQTRIDAETLDDSLEMEDSDSGISAQYGCVMHCYNVDFEIDGVEVIDDDVDPADVLEAELEQLEARISWDAETLSKQKAFLEALLKEDADERAAA